MDPVHGHAAMQPALADQPHEGVHDVLELFILAAPRQGIFLTVPAGTEPDLMYFRIIACHYAAVHALYEFFSFHDY